MRRRKWARVHKVPAPPRGGGWMAWAFYLLLLLPLLYYLVLGGVKLELSSAQVAAGEAVVLRVKGVSP